MAIHGHGGHREDSWTDRETGVSWLRDFLPGVLGEARVLSYGYDASDALGKSVEELVREFVAALLVAREGIRVGISPSFLLNFNTVIWVSQLPYVVWHVEIIC